MEFNQPPQYERESANTAVFVLHSIILYMHIYACILYMHLFYICIFLFHHYLNQSLFISPLPDHSSSTFLCFIFNWFCIKNGIFFARNVCVANWVRISIWDKVFKNGPSKICGRQPLKNLKGYGLFKYFIF